MMELKPCPFCGGKPYLEKSSRAFLGGESQRVSYVRCTKCEARSPKIPISRYGHSCYSIDAQNAAAEAWNRRADNG